MTCASCRWSPWIDHGLYCTATGEAASTRCEDFEYEPGTDEKENNNG